MAAPLKQSEHAIEWTSLAAVSALDDWVHHREDIFHASLETVEALQVDSARAAVRHHQSNNEDYRIYCERLQFDSSEIVDVASLARIPLITSSQFKLRQVLSVPERDIVKICTSSGTQGSISEVFRDETTLCRFLSSVRSCMEQLVGLDDAYCAHLGPSKEEADDLWISYAMSVTDMQFPTENFVVDGEYHPERLVKRIRDVRDDFEHVMLIGAPVMYLRLLEYLEESGESLDECGNFVAITAGGWKRFSGESISRAAMVKRLQKAFRGLRDDNVRDFFNMVEFNSVLGDCSHGVKHAPPWARLLIVDPRTLQSVPDGESGLFAFVDPTSTSYPGFILTDDFARISLNGTCGCGRTGQGIEFIRRVNRGESRGCALKIDRAYAGRDK